jgi:hypothetical protein
LWYIGHRGPLARKTSLIRNNNISFTVKQHFEIIYLIDPFFVVS